MLALAAPHDFIAFSLPAFVASTAAMWADWRTAFLMDTLGVRKGDDDSSCPFFSQNPMSFNTLRSMRGLYSPLLNQKYVQVHSICLFVSMVQLPLERILVVTFVPLTENGIPAQTSEQQRP